MSARMRTRTPTAFVGSLTALLAVSVSACTGGSEEADDPSTSSPRVSAQPKPSTPRPKSPPSPTTASPTQPSMATHAATPPSSAAPVQPPPAGSGPEAMLLRAREMPGLNEEHGWRTIATDDHERGRPIWVCQVTDFTSIGATGVWVRRFVGQPGGAESAKARSAVITFADGQSARRAYAVLQAWHDRCEEQLRGFRRVDVDGAPTPVEGAEGQGEWRMAVYGPAEGEREAAYFDATGYVVKGSRISLATMVSVGQDYNYPRGEEPIVQAVRNSATKLLG